MGCWWSCMNDFVVLFFGFDGVWIRRKGLAERYK